MAQIPEYLNADNKHNFKDLHFTSVKQKLRCELHDHILAFKESQYYDLNRFIKEHLDHTINDESFDKMLEEVRDELHKLNWKTETSFGGTGLFIFKDTPPENYYPDGFE